MDIRNDDHATEPPNGSTANENHQSQPVDVEREQTAGARNDGTEGVVRRRRKASYALALQKTCETAGDRVKSNNLIANTNWASPLATAPSAISTMAILFKAADRDCAHGLEVSSQDVMDIENNTIRGRLPSKYFHTNLQHCSDIGRLAFLDAQHGMNTIQATARSLIAEDGNICTIVALLEDPDDARYSLKPEIEALKQSAKRCLDNAQIITSKFAYWYCVIMHLKKISLDGIDETTMKERGIAAQKASVQQDAAMFQGKKGALKEKIAELQQKLETARVDVDRAQEEVEWLKNLPSLTEPSALEEYMQVQRMFPHKTLPAKERGILLEMKDWIFGKSDEDIKEDAKAQDNQNASVNKAREGALERAREQRDHQRRLAADKLKEARERESKTKNALDGVHQELRASNYQLAQAKSNLEKTKSDLALLSDKAIELKDIMAILDKATTHLGILKDQVEQLVDFFTDILQGITHTVDEDLEGFLRPIISGITEGSSPEEVEALRIGQTMKKKMMSNAFQMQGRFSAVADISNAYIAVSKEYIRPAILKMEELSALPESEWMIRSQEFTKWCSDSINDIDQLAQRVGRTAEGNIDRNIRMLQRRAIEAAAEQDE